MCFPKPWKGCFPGLVRFRVFRVFRGELSLFWLNFVDWGRRSSYCFGTMKTRYWFVLLMTIALFLRAEVQTPNDLGNRQGIFRRDMALLLRAEAQTPIPLWADGAPGVLGKEDK